MSQQPKWTPGPWTAVAGSVFTESDSPCFEIVHGSYLTRRGTEEQRQADASLIAAAPELVEALHSLLGAVEDNYGLPEVDPREAKSTLARARAALRKAGAL